MISEFVISAVEKEQWPESDLPEVVVVGRSNVGKSSFINALTNKKKLAYVGNTPGKTRLINFFKIDDTWMLVDVPGYGYAKMSKHGATHDDLDMIEMIQSLGIQIVIVATKVDKIPKTKRVRALKDISQQLHLPMKNIFGISSTEKTGFEPVLEKINEIVEQAKK